VGSIYVPAAQPAQSVLFAAGSGVQFGGPTIPTGRIEASDDGQQWRTWRICLGPGAGSVNFPVRTFSVMPVNARYYRLFFKAQPPDPTRPCTGRKSMPPVRLTEIEFLAGPRIQQWEDKASFGIYAPTRSPQGAEVKPGEAIDASKVVDLTGKMRSDGTLDWDAPAGRWIVMRLGYGITGEVNHPRPGSDRS